MSTYIQKKGCKGFGTSYLYLIYNFDLLKYLGGLTFLSVPGFYVRVDCEYYFHHDKLMFKCKSRKSLSNFEFEKEETVDNAVEIVMYFDTV